MDFRRIEVFVEVVKSGTFSRAAEKLFLTQPTVSAHIAHLEREAGSPLFERRGRKIVLTPAGEEFYPFALDIISLKEKAREQLEKYQNEARGLIDIVTSSTPGNYLLPAFLKKFNEIYPEITFSLSITHSRRAMEMVAGYECDLGITGEVENKGEKDTGRGVKKFLVHQDRMVGIVPCGHEWEGKRVNIEDLKKEPLILPKLGSATRRVFCDSLSSKGHLIKDFKFFMEVNSLEGIKNHVREGLGAGLISGIAVQPNEGLGTFEVKELDLERKFFVIYNSRRVFPGRVERFLAFLREGGASNGKKDLS